MKVGAGATASAGILPGMPMMSTRVLGGVCGALLVGAGCSDKFEMVTVALMTDPESTGVTTGGTTSETTTPTPTDSGDPSGDPGGDPTEATTAAPVTCDTPEACTDEGEGDVGPLTLPFFRGMVCVSDEIQPGDKLAVSISACVHPCLDVSGFKFKSLFRGADVGVEMALAFYYPEVTGTACPPDVFGEFPAEACVYTGPTKVSVGPVLQNDVGYAGVGTFLVPFLSNEDVAAMAAGDDAADQVWTRIESHTQASGRTFEMSFDAGNSAAPAECGDGIGGCTCRSIGL